ncbi:MAG: hypothetical protein WB630_16000 [Candidatus Acidiferrales bacterium]
MNKIKKPKLGMKKTESQLEPRPEPSATTLVHHNTSLQAASPVTSAPEVSQKSVMEKLHPHFLALHAYFGLSEAMGNGLLDTAGVGAGNFLQAKGGNSLLQLAHTLALLAHGRAAWLTQRAAVQTDPRSLAVHLQACERATATFLQLMRAIDENRQLPAFGDGRLDKKTDSKISIGQANVGGQHLVQNIVKLELPPKEDSNEQTRFLKGAVINDESLSAVPGGAQRPQSGHPKKSPVDKKHRTKNRKGKGAGRKKRA